VSARISAQNSARFAALPEPLQPIDRTCVLHRGRKLSYFGGCDYFRLASHPKVLAAVRDGLDRFGLNVAASRKTTGNHALYEKLEKHLATFFGVEAAFLVSSGYLINLVVAQVLAGEFTHALIDERAHVSLIDAGQLLRCKVRYFRHRDARAVASAVRSCGKDRRLILLTDGLFAHSGEVAPLDEYLRVLPRNALLLVDDAHGAGTIGKAGRGTPEFLGIPMRRVIQTITLSKAFGAYGGAILCSPNLRARIIARSRIFAGNTPLPLPLVAGGLAALEILRGDPALHRRLAFNLHYIKAALREAGFDMNSGPGPIVPLHPPSATNADKLQRALVAAGIHPPFISYGGGPSEAYFRFAISSEHSAAQLDNLARVLTGWKRSAER
jgi:7-keto-8-aminopelargonate synthetase-like enzyme